MALLDLANVDHFVVENVLVDVYSSVLGRAAAQLVDLDVAVVHLD